MKVKNEDEFMPRVDALPEGIQALEFTRRKAVGREGIWAVMHGRAGSRRMMDRPITRLPSIVAMSKAILKRDPALLYSDQ